MSYRLNCSLIAALLSGCNYVSMPNHDLDRAVTEVSSNADACLLEVRDGHADYSKAGNCRALGEAINRYIEAGGMHSGESLQNQLKFANARAVAFAALASSLSQQNGGPSMVGVW